MNKRQRQGSLVEIRLRLTRDGAFYGEVRWPWRSKGSRVLVSAGGPTLDCAEQWLKDKLDLLEALAETAERARAHEAL